LRTALPRRRASRRTMWGCRSRGPANRQ
jgi:hypothetical protein